MKKIGTYTVRGQTTEEEQEAGEPFMIRLFDGKFDTGYKVVGFKVWSRSYTGSSQPDCIGKLGTTNNLPGGPTEFFNAQDVRELAWATSAGSTDGGLGFADSIIDPDNFVVEDLFVYVRSTTDGTPINYIVNLEKYDTTDANGALAMVRNNAQNVLGDN
jgi:hypothetical protein